MLLRRLSQLSTSIRLGLIPLMLAGTLQGTLTSPGLASLSDTSGSDPTSPSLSLDADILVDTISTGLYHTCGVKTDGTLACWGYDGYEQVSGPNQSPDTFTQVSGGGYHTCGLKSDDTLACWGHDQYGQVSGPNDSSDTFIQVSGGGYHTCGVKADGTLACWGYDGYGQVSGPNHSSDIFIQVSAGLYHTCGVKPGGALACWGNDGYGQVSSPSQSSDTFIQVSGGGYHTCGVKTDGGLACWGHDWYGQVWNPNHSTDTFIQVSAGMYHTCGVKTSGALACWGNDKYGQVSGPSRSTDIFTQVSAGGDHTYGVKTDHTPVGWGSNDYGQSDPFNRPPTDITLSVDNVDENRPVNAEIGVLAAVDPNAGDTHTYSLVSTGPCPGPDNGYFNISADKLRTSAVFDYEAKAAYAICIRADDGKGGLYDEPFAIHVNNVNEAPVNTLPPAQTTPLNTALTFSASAGNPISIGDVDANGYPLQVTLTADHGTLTLNGASGLTFSAGDGLADATMVFTGTTTSVNAALDGMGFDPTLDYTGEATIQLVSDDQGYTGSGGPLTDDDRLAISIAPPAAQPRAFHLFLPVVARAAVSAPDLVVDSLVAAGDALTVTIRNTGTATASNAFWVDVYFDPVEVPGVNKPWDTIASYGTVWGVTRPILAGETLLLTNRGDYFFPEYSSVFPPGGAEAYALVDSINFSSTAGAVQEADESNNLFGPVISTSGVASGATVGAGQGQLVPGTALPPRQKLQ
jgi:alpha-tubulin suppressor-like RCC1 family protein